MIAASETSADMFYITRFRAPDAFVFLEFRGRTALLLSDLELDRAAGGPSRRGGQLLELEKELQRGKKQKPTFAKVVGEFLKRHGVRHVVTPRDFPLGLAQSLRGERIRVEAAEGNFWPQRQFKPHREVEALEEALRIAEAGMARGHKGLESFQDPQGRHTFLERADPVRGSATH